MKKLTLASTAILLALAAPTQAAEETHTLIETNSDGSTTTTTTTSRYYYGNDANNNGILDSQEFPTYVYHRWDRDGDGFLSDDEWTRSSPRWYGAEPRYKTHTAWDKNGDGRLDATEFDVVINESKLYSAWDADANTIIEGDEYAAATFRLYDENDDGQLSLQEWKNAQ